MLTVGPAVAARCIRPSGLRVASEYAEENEFAVQIIAVLISERVVGKSVAGPSLAEELKLFARVGAACRELCNYLDTSDLWPRLCSVRVCNTRQLSPNFSTFLLAHEIHGARLHEHLRRQCLLGLGVSTEADLLSPTSITDIFVSETPAQEKALWCQRFESAFQTSSVPTKQQCDDMLSTLTILLAEGHGKSYQPEAGSPMATARDAIAMACRPSSNDVLRAQLFAQLSRQPASTTDGRACLFQLLSDVKSCQHALGFLHGLSVDDVMQGKWELKKSFHCSRSTSRALLDALAGFNFLQLSQLRRNMGLWKAIFKSARLNGLILKRVAAAEAHEQEVAGHNEVAAASAGVRSAESRSAADYRKVGFFLSVLRQERYPADPAAFAASDWAQRIIGPLSTLSANPAFCTPEPAWLAAEFQPSLAGQKLKLPPRNSVESVLSRLGNRRATWETLFESKSLTAAQILGNLRSMAREGAIDGGSSLTFLALFFVNYEPHLVALALPKSFMS